MLKFTINRFLDLRLEDGKTNIYVDNKLFRHCKHVLIETSTEQPEIIDNINSIDEIIERLGQSNAFTNISLYNIAPETLFWGHCSNLQSWYENHYDSCLIHSNLAFPLLKELMNAGDLLATKVFKEEIAKRIGSKNMNTICFLLYGGYLDYLNKEEVEFVLFDNLIGILVNQLSELMNSSMNNFTKIKDILDLVLFIDLKYNQNLILCVFNKINEKFKYNFARLLVFHLNYKEFKDYKIPYGRFFIYFEQVLDFMYENYSEIRELIKFIDSGFNSGAISLDDKLSYGSISQHSLY